ncbi:hypothetical protein DAMA08_019010 [Martiniozyma asiatica (nom. inval.)]|nr:hypothetical protein DAMA08_019010 [Martiniozyma asiatica]
MLSEVKGNIPRLHDILDDKVAPQSPYSKLNFVQYLVTKHCIENYEFYSEIIAIINNYDFYKRHHTTADWFSIYTEYIEGEVVNLPDSLLNNITKNELPDLESLKQMEKTVSGYLYMTYCEFVAGIKKEQEIAIENYSSSSVKSLGSPCSTSATSEEYEGDISSDASISTKIVCKCNSSDKCEKYRHGHGGWTKLTNKFKWRRPSHNTY